MLRKIVLLLGYFPLVRHALRWLSHFQLRLALILLVRHRDLLAVLLRRREVLVDAYPGDSDYDLTLVVRPASGPRLLEVAGRYRRLKQIFPVLGEALLVDARDLADHLALAFPDYGTEREPFVLFGDVTGHVDGAIPRNDSSVLFRAVQLWKFRLAAPLLELPAHRPVFARPLLKNARKLQWLESLLAQRDPGSLRYDRDPGNAPRWLEPHRLEPVARAAWDAIVALPLPSVPPEAELDWIVHGNPDVASPTEKSYLDVAFAELRERYAGAIEAVTVSPLRLHRFVRSLYVHLKSNTGVDAALNVSLHRVGQHLRTFPFRFTPNVPIAVEPREWRRVLAADPIAAQLFSLVHYDVISGRERRSSPPRIRLSTWSVRRELVDTVTLLQSMGRREDTNYFFDLFFGHLLPFVRALETGTFPASLSALHETYLSPRGMTDAQRELFAIYVEACEDTLDRIPTARALDVFAFWVHEECEKARRLWHYLEPPDADRRGNHRSAAAIPRLGAVQS